MVLTKEKEIGLEDENTLVKGQLTFLPYFHKSVTSVDSWMITFAYMCTLQSMEANVLEDYLCSLLFKTTLYLLTITINTISRDTIVILFIY